MMKIVFSIFSFLLVIGCTKTKIQKEYYEDGTLFSEKIFPNRHDTSSYYVTKFYPSGEILNRYESIKGKKEGGFFYYLQNGILLQRRNYQNGKLDGLLQYFDTTGLPSREEYFINGKRILYCPFYESNDNRYQKQEFTFIQNDSSYIYGNLVIDITNNQINRSLSFCPIIRCKDTIENVNNCFLLEIIPPFPKLKYEITFGRPNSNLKITEIDTSFVTRDSLIKICNLKMRSGINHLFCKIKLSFEDSSTIKNAYGDSAIMYAYKDVFLKSKKKNKLFD